MNSKRNEFAVGSQKLLLLVVFFLVLHWPHTFNNNFLLNWHWMLETAVKDIEKFGHNYFYAEILME